MSLDYRKIVLGDVPENPDCPKGCGREHMTSVPLNREEVRANKLGGVLRRAKQQHPLAKKIELLWIFCTKCEYGSWDLYIQKYSDEPN